jgi:uncharacterized protein (TIGR03663 family)
MAIAELPTRIAESPADIARPVERSQRWRLSYEQSAYLLLFGLALLAHLWGLGDRALHHDETLHAFYSWQLFQGNGFTHDPLLHGPFLYHMGAAIYFLFGDSNFTARLGVALFGSVLVVLPYLIRRELGRGAALLASLYLLISPAFLYVGRFIRHDTYAVTFEMLAFIGIVRYASTRRARWLYLAAAALGLMFTTMETFFLYVAIFGSLLVLVFLWRIWRPALLVAAAVGLTAIAAVFVLPGQPERTGDTVARAAGAYVCPVPGAPAPPVNPMLYTPGPILGLPPLATADNDYALCVRNEPDNSFATYFVKLGQFFGHPAILLALAVTVAGLVALYALLWRRRGPDGKTAWQRARAKNDGLLDAFASLAWDRRVLGALAIFGTIYALFFTAFFANPTGVVSGATGSLLYWLAQHGVQRGSQPVYYYLVVLAIYEPLVLLWSIAGLIMVATMIGRFLLRRRASTAAQDGAADRRDNGTAGAAHERSLDWSFVMPLALVWWSITTLALYSWAGEKMPWLTIHVALPLVLLGAWAFARTLRWWSDAQTPALAYAGATPSASATGNGHESALAHEPQPLARPSAPLLMYLGVFGIVAVLCFLLMTIIGKPDGPQRDLTPLIPLLGLVLMTLLTVGAGLLRGPRWAIGALAIAITLLGGLYGLRSSYQLSYRWGDVPREMLIYTQTSPDVARVIDRLEQASMRRGGTLEMPIWYDNETVWQWYLRRFTGKVNQSPALGTPPGNDVQAVLMLQENLDAYPQNAQDLQGFRIQRFPLRWWFPEDQTYRLPPGWTSAQVTPDSPLLMRLLRTPTDGRTVAQLWQYLIYRQLPAPLGSTDFVLAVRPDLADEIGLGTGAPQK